VDDPDKAITWQTIADLIIIEEKLLARNIKQFSQAQGTLFTTKRLQELFGYKGTTEATSELLTEKLSAEHYPPMTQGGTTLLNLLGNKGNLTPIDHNIDIPIFNKAMQTSSEGTSTSHRGRHLGHHKCLLKDDGSY
jgi:hypothetical protein